MAQTFREFIVEGQIWEYSQEYYNLLKEANEIELMDRYLDNQVFLSENMDLFEGEDSILTESYFMEYASDESFEQINESFGEKVGKVFDWIGRKLGEIFKAIGSFFAWIGKKIVSIFKGKNGYKEKIETMSEKEIDELLEETNGKFVTPGGGVGVKQPNTKGLNDRNFKVGSFKKAVTIPDNIIKANVKTKKQYLIDLANAEEFLIIDVDAQGNERNIDVVALIDALNALNTAGDGFDDAAIIRALKILQKKGKVSRDRAGLTQERIQQILDITTVLQKKAKVAQVKTNEENKTGKNGYASKGKVSSAGVAALNQLYKEVSTLMEDYNAQVQRVQAVIEAINKKNSHAKLNEALKGTDAYASASAKEAMDKIDAQKSNEEPAKAKKQRTR